MKKVAVAVLVLGMFGGVAWAVGRSPERSACIKLGELCADAKKGSVAELDQCVDQVKELRKLGGDAPVDKALTCIDGAKTCPEAMGCVAGAGYAALPGLMNEFGKGFARGAK